MFYALAFILLGWILCSGGAVLWHSQVIDIFCTLCYALMIIHSSDQYILCQCLTCSLIQGYLLSNDACLKSCVILNCPGTIFEYRTIYITRFRNAYFFFFVAEKLKPVVWNQTILKKEFEFLPKECLIIIDNTN